MFWCPLITKQMFLVNCLYICECEQNVSKMKSRRRLKLGIPFSYNHSIEYEDLDLDLSNGSATYFLNFLYFLPINTYHFYLKHFPGKIYFLTV
uniref:Putative secreted protein n=1 Tax=Panstrongylus lignarius TaxID=156445 RepID=A0A224XRI1_9HEMI